MTKYDFLIGKKIQWTLQPPGHEVKNTKIGIVTKVKETVSWGDNMPCWIGTLKLEDGKTCNVFLEDYDVKIKMLKLE